MLKFTLKKGQNLSWDCTYPIKVSESYDQSVNHLAPQLNSLVWSSKKWCMRILSDLHEILVGFFSSDPWAGLEISCFLQAFYLTDTLLIQYLALDTKWHIFHKIVIFPHFVICWMHFIVCFFKPCLTAALRFVESVRTLPKPFKKRIQHLKYDFKNLKQWAQKIGEDGF